MGVTRDKLAVTLLSFGRMEIAYVGPVPPLMGGIAQHGARLTEALEEMGAIVHIYSWASQYPRLLYRGPWSKRGPAPSPGRVSFALRWWDPSSWWRVGRRARDADLLVMPWVSPVTALAYRVVLAAASPTPSVFVVHNLRPHEARPGDRVLTRWVLRRARGALFHSAPDATTMRSWEPHVRVRVVDHPPNLPMSTNPAPDPPPYRLLFFGHVRAYKGLDTALESLRYLLDEGLPVELTVAGHFWEPVARWQDRIMAEDLGSVVSLKPGYVPDDEVGALFSDHHIVVAPYRSATQSGIVPLARAAGRPVVITNVGALSDSISEGIDGEMSPPEDPQSFASAIERVIERMGRPALPGDAAEASWTDVARAVLELGR